MTAAVELVGAEAGGAQLPAAAAVRIGLADGVLSGRGYRRAIDVPAGDVRRALWLTEPRTRSLLGRPGHGPRAGLRPLLGLVVLLDGADRPVLAFYVQDFAPVTAGDDRDHLDIAGATQLAKALGTVIEPGDGIALDRDAVRAVLVGRRRWRAKKFAAPLLAIATGVTGFLGAPGGEEWWGLPSLLLSLLLGAVLVWWLVTEQLRFQAATAAAPALDDRVRFPAEVSDAATSQLQLGRTRLVAWAGWRLSRRRGPMLPGGVTQCRVGPEETRFQDARGLTHWTFETRELVPDDRALAALRGACDAVGIELAEEPEPVTEGGTLFRQGWTFDKQLPPDRLLSADEDGAISFQAPTLLTIALAAQLLGDIVQVDEHRGVVWAVLAVTAVEAATLLWTHLRFRRSRRAVIAANPRTVPAPRLDWWRSRWGVGGTRAVHRSPQQQGPVA